MDLEYSVISCIKHVEYDAGLNINWKITWAQQMIWSSLVDFNVNNFFSIVKIIKKKNIMLRTVLYYKIYDMIFFQSIFKVHLQRKWRLWEQLKSTLQLTFWKKMPAKRKKTESQKLFDTRVSGCDSIESFRHFTWM